jgi:signal peptide peptidase SppA
MPPELQLAAADRIIQRFGQAAPHLEDYFGLWSIHEPIFRSAVERFNTIDLAAHIASAEAKNAVKQQAEDDYELTPDGVALFQISGPMMKSVSSLSAGTSTVRVRQQIRSARKNEAVRGAMLVMDTPGGTVRGNRDLCDEVAAFAAEKPIFAFVDDLCASAGVSVASQATKRFANNASAMYGAMGTYSVLVDANRAAENAGYTVHVIKAGDFKGMGEMGTKITEAQLAEANRLVNAQNDEYLAVIAQGLSLPLAQIKAIADGRVLLAAAALEAGLINGVQTYEQTYRQLVAAAQSKRPTSKVPAAGIPARALAAGAANSTKSEPLKGARMDPATLAELKAKFPKSSAEWRETQIEAAATLQDAAINYANYLEERSTKLQTDLDAANKATASAAKKSGSLGHDALKERSKASRAAKKADDADDEGDEEDDDESSSSYTGDAVMDFHAAVRKIAGRNPSLSQRQAAIRLVTRRDPDLYRQYLLANNSSKRQVRLIEEKLEAN